MIRYSLSNVFKLRSHLITEPLGIAISMSLITLPPRFECTKYGCTNSKFSLILRANGISSSHNHPINSKLKNSRSPNICLILALPNLLITSCSISIRSWLLLLPHLFSNIVIPKSPPTSITCKCCKCINMLFAVLPIAPIDRYIKLSFP